MVADDHALPAQRAGLHGHHPLAVDQQGETATVDGDHATGDGVVVAGTILGARTGATTGPLVVLLVVIGVTPAHGWPVTREVQVVAKSGNVLDVVAMSSTRTPSTTEPRTTPAWAIRWSA